MLLIAPNQSGNGIKPNYDYTISYFGDVYNVCNCEVPGTVGQCELHSDKSENFFSNRSLCRVASNYYSRFQCEISRLT